MSIIAHSPFLYLPKEKKEKRKSNDPHQNLLLYFDS